MNCAIARVLAAWLLAAAGRPDSICAGFLSITPTESARSSGGGGGPGAYESPSSETFTVPLTTVRPEPTTALSKLDRLWNNLRPITITSLVCDALDNTSEEGRDSSDVPYCLVSDGFPVDGMHLFRISLFPRGRFSAGSSKDLKANNGPASAYLRYVPNAYGDEVDISWRLTLVDAATGAALPALTSGGLPRSNTAWSTGMTLCAENVDVESCGRAADWGFSAWPQDAVCAAMAGGFVEARIKVQLYGSRG